MAQQTNETEAERRVGSVHVGIPTVMVTPFDYSFAVTGSIAGGKPVSRVPVPAGAFVIGGWYQVSTTFTSSSDAATIAISIVGANDLKTAIAISDATNPWDVDLTKRWPLKRITTQIASPVFVTMTSATEVLTAGVLFGVVEWLLPNSYSAEH